VCGSVVGGDVVMSVGLVVKVVGLVKEVEKSGISGVSAVLDVYVC